MATARKLPSGNYRVRVFVGTDGDKKIYKSITAPTKKEAEYQAAQIKMENRIHVTQNETLQQAIEHYIKSKENLLSPSTIAGYHKISRNYYQKILHKKISSITQKDLEIEVNRMAKILSPKTTSSAYFFMLSVIRSIDPFFKSNVRLPQRKQTTKIIIPSFEDYVRMVQYAKGTDMEVPILLFGCMGLRVSELRALTWEDIDFQAKTLSVNKALVRGDKGEYLKQPKSDAGSRILIIPDICIHSLMEADKKDKHVTTLSTSMLEKRMYKICNDLNIPRMSPHKLRHFQDSFLHAINIPTSYGMQRMGHVTEAMYNRQYNHEIPEQQRIVDQQINNKFTEIFEIYATKCDTKQ